MGCQNSKGKVHHGVEDLDLMSKGLTEPPGNLRQYPDLKVLNLDSNKLTTPPNLSNNPSLTYLFLEHNQLTTPADLSNLPNLTQLHLHHNKLSALPDIHACTKLTTLTLSDNALTGKLYPADVWPKTLTYLDISNNPDLWGEIPKALVLQCTDKINYSGCRWHRTCTAEQRRLLQFLRGPFFVGFTVASEDITDYILQFIEHLGITEDNMMDAPATGKEGMKMLLTHGKEWMAWQEVWLDGLFALARGTIIWAVLTEDGDEYEEDGFQIEGHFKRKLEDAAAFDTDDKCNAMSFDPCYRLPEGTRATSILDWEARQFAIAQEKYGLVVKSWRGGGYTGGATNTVAPWYPVPHVAEVNDE